MSVIDDTRKVVQDFLAPELRSISVRLDSLDKQRAEDSARMDKQRAEDIARMDKQRAEDKADLLKAISAMGERLEKQRTDDRVHFLEVVGGLRTQMDRRFNDLIDYNKMGQRVDKLEEDNRRRTSRCLRRPCSGGGTCLGGHYLSIFRFNIMDISMAIVNKPTEQYWTRSR